ncbi:hypothetical protein DESC_870087 [Desulfosarcina cetonica]|nr:hypothetical protein DESC_870087 [Desulfosarcina cetonica]
MATESAIYFLLAVLSRINVM